MPDRVIAPGEWLEGRLVRLRLVELSDCTERYVAWLADPEVNRYLETRWTPQTMESIRGFVSSMLASPHSYLFGIFPRASGQHIGNVKVGPIDPHHLYADVSYFLGERDAWGKGYGTDAVRVATKFGFERCGLHRIQAGFYETNVGSQRVLEKAGFVFEHRQSKKLRQREDAPWEDHLWYAALRDTWRADG
jgi:RimJ/RimL family protein N-acetyltransferase